LQPCYQFVDSSILLRLTTMLPRVRPRRMPDRLEAPRASTLIEHHGEQREIVRDGHISAEVQDPTLDPVEEAIPGVQHLLGQQDGQPLEFGAFGGPSGTRG